MHLHASGAGKPPPPTGRVVNRPGFNATPTIETGASRASIIVSGSGHSASSPVLYGPEPVFVVEPGKVIRGVVRDAGTGKPWPGVEVHCNANSATTDAAGRYEIRGVHKDNSYSLWVHADLSAGLLGRQVTVPDTDDYAPVAADIAVTRATQASVITGRLIDAATGKGIRGDIHLAALADNASARMLRYHHYDHSTSTAEDGTFRIVTIPGPVLLMGGVDYEWSPAGQAYRSIKYKRAKADPRYPQYFPADQPGAYASAAGRFKPLQGSFCKVLQIEPGTTVKEDITVDPAKTVPIEIQDATGRPLVNTLVWEDGRKGLRRTASHCKRFMASSGRGRVRRNAAPGLLRTQQEAVRHAHAQERRERASGRAVAPLWRCSGNRRRRGRQAFVERRQRLNPHSYL